MQHREENKAEVVAGGYSVMTFWRWLRLLIFTTALAFVVTRGVVIGTPITKSSGGNND